MQRGKFVVVEGPDGTGKTTFAKALVDTLNQKSMPSIFLREPGGSAASEAIRDCALSPAVMGACGNTRMLLMFAARIQLCKETIDTTLKGGVNVVCDRYSLSTYIYQVLGEDADYNLFRELNRYVTKPDVLFLLTAPFDVCYQRTLDRDQAGRNGYDDVSLGRKLDVWEKYTNLTATEIYDMGFRTLERLDSGKFTTEALIGQALLPLR